MVETFTQNELIMAIYHELSSDEMVGLESQLNTNFEIEDNFEHLQEMKTALDQLKVSPRQAIIDQILAFSKSFVNSFSYFFVGFRTFFESNEII